ncbi:MAG: hypothetical protein ABW277_24750 [Longimicrobiaceae bacterium]
MAQAATLDTTYTWLHFVGMSCEEGRRWAEEYLRYSEVVDMNYECLVLLKRRRFAEGAAHLRRFRERVDGAGDAHPSIRAVLDRWYHAVDGYYWYCMEAYDTAERAMIHAHDAVATAIEHLPCLVPLANHCHEFRLHRARIARNLHRWPEMWGHVAEVRGMFQGKRPFCELSDGTGIGLGRVRDFYDSLGPLSEDERASVAYVLDERTRMREFDRFVHAMCRLPGFVIQYP